MPEIQRYLLKNKEKGQDFDKFHTLGDTFCTTWYVGKGKMGMIVKHNSQEECFYRAFFKDFFEADENLLVRRAGDYPIIMRDRIRIEALGRDDQVKKLAELLLDNELIHCYLAREHQCKNCLPEILSFSTRSPSKRLYIPGKKMGIIEVF